MTPLDDLPKLERRHFFGRRRGKTLRPAQAEALEMALQDLALDLKSPSPDDVLALFGHRVAEVRVEIGFGGGEHLLHQLARLPNAGFIGVEPFVNGCAKVAAQLTGPSKDFASRVRLFDDDATKLLHWLPDSQLAGVDVFYPDPWPKPRHWKRRFLDKARLDEIARVLKVGAEFRFASDIPSYVDWVLERVQRIEALEWTALCADDWRKPYDGWPGTRYEQKALRAGRTPAYFRFQRK